MYKTGLQQSIPYFCPPTPIFQTFPASKVLFLQAVLFSKNPNFKQVGSFEKTSILAIVQVEEVCKTELRNLILEVNGTKDLTLVFKWNDSFCCPCEHCLLFLPKVTKKLSFDFKIKASLWFLVKTNTLQFASLLVCLRKIQKIPGRTQFFSLVTKTSSLKLLLLVFKSQNSYSLFANQFLLDPSLTHRHLQCFIQNCPEKTVQACLVRNTMGV